jgi:hypothetical protein
MRKIDECPCVCQDAHTYNSMALLPLGLVVGWLCLSQRQSACHKRALTRRPLHPERVKVVHFKWYACCACA